MPEINLKAGLLAVEEIKVSKNYTAKEVGSGSIDVYATPSMIALMEKAALLALEAHLPEGYTTVGTMLNIKHIAATPVGLGVRAVAELTHVEGKKLTFKVEAFDEAEKIGEGIHERYIVDSARFREKVYSKSATK